MMGPNMNGLYNMFGGVQQFQQRYNQVQQMFNQLRRQGMTPYYLRCGGAGHGRIQLH